jgi:PAN domain
LWYFIAKGVLLCGGDIARHARRRMRAVMVGFAALIFASAITAMGVAPAAAQSGYDRPGGDYASAPVANGDPTVCASRCERDKGCRAWSFSYPSPSGEPAMCWLKREVRPPVRANCCVSGVRGAGVVEPLLGEFEYSIDRVGGDYRSFDTGPDAGGTPCAVACRIDPHCRAWTYRRTGYGAPAARCYLKDAVKRPHRRPCCISGVVR